jgi:MYXO-CTERM domain-containing protein
MLWLGFEALTVPFSAPRSTSSIPMNPIHSLFTLASIALLFQGSAFAAQTAGYKFDETAGNTATDAIRGATGNGTLSNFGGAQWVPGKIGMALDFDGTNDFVLSLNALPTGTTAFSISLWAWADTGLSWNTLVKNWGEASTGAFHLGLDAGSGRLSNYLGAPTAGPITSGAFTLGTWHHVALTWSGTTHSEVLYLDGAQVAALSTPALNSLVALGNVMAFGVKPNEAGTGAATDCCPGYWDGKMDDVAFFNTVLAPAEVAQIKTNGDNGISVISVPEPGSAILGLAGLAGLFLRRRR